jgi:hypothetical protein
MGHQVSDLRSGKIGDRERLEMKEEPVSKGLFDSAGGSQEEVSPDIPESADAKSKEQDRSAVSQKTGRSDTALREIIDGILDHSRDEELEDVHDEQRQKANEEPPSVLKKIIFEGPKRFHSGEV